MHVADQHISEPTQKMNKVINVENTTGSQFDVIVTPTRNLFDVLEKEMEYKGNMVVDQFKTMGNELALVDPFNNLEGSLSDGSGTRSVSNSGIPKHRSLPNSDDDEPEKKDKTKRNLQIIRTSRSSSQFFLLMSIELSAQDNIITGGIIFWDCHGHWRNHGFFNGSF